MMMMLMMITMTTTMASMMLRITVATVEDDDNYQRMQCWHDNYDNNGKSKDCQKDDNVVGNNYKVYSPQRYQEFCSLKPKSKKFKEHSLNVCK